MKFTLNWLQQYVQLHTIAPEKLADDLTMLGLEVDSVVPLYEELSGLLTAKVISVMPHPNADKLTLCQVAAGDNTLQVVCGAPNVRKGFCGVIALPGTILPGNLKIKKSKVRGVESQGMLCSERELGLSEEHTGILELPDDTQHGQSFLEVSGLRDILIEVDLTPNRPDCASVIGIAREVAGIYRTQLSIPFENIEYKQASQSFSVEVEDTGLCPRYAARLIKGITIGPSPWWLRKQLLSVGMRPINNVVDITNFVMLEYGQPLHAFDFKTLADQTIIVRTPRQGEKEFTTLDNVNRPLDPDMLMICDSKGPVAVAGVMGGLDSEVTEKTTDVLLESACFNSISIRKTARKLNLPSEASYRFERGVDPGGTLNAMERAVSLICEIAGGSAEQNGVDVYGGYKPLEPLTLRISRTTDLLGLPLTVEQVSELLESIAIRCTPKDNDTLVVNPPSFRVDLEREVDLVEEVARLIGYNDIPISLPSVDLSYPEQDQERIRRNAACSIMTKFGFTEAINYSFYSSSYDVKMLLEEADKRCSHVKILNPLTEDQDVMRTMLLPGLFENIRQNISFQQTSCKLFEIGDLFFPVQGKPLPNEVPRMAGVMTGNRHGSQSPLHYKNDAVDIYDIKGAVEGLLEEMRLHNGRDLSAVRLTPAAVATAEPYAEEEYGLSIIYDNKSIGSIGKIKDEVLRDFGIKREVFYFDIDFKALAGVPSAPKEYSALPIYPSVKRDIALVVPAQTAAGDLVDSVISSKEKLVEHCDVFDVYQGNKIQGGFKSVALTITYRSQTKTLTEKNVEKAHVKLVNMLTDRFGGSFREA
jgi:phenylalanyl-tRNA synthetase beta chain